MGDTVKGGDKNSGIKRIRNKKSLLEFVCGKVFAIMVNGYSPIINVGTFPAIYVSRIM